MKLDDFIPHTQLELTIVLIIVISIVRFIIPYRNNSNSSYESGSTDSYDSGCDGGGDGD